MATASILLAMQEYLSQRVFVFIALVALLLLPSLSHAQWKLVSPDCAFPVSKRYFNIVGDDRPATDTKFKAGITPPPQSQYASLLAESEEAYDLGAFTVAAEKLKPLVEQKSVAPAVLNQYARSLYNIEGGKPSSYTVYQRLIDLLNKYGGENSATSTLYLPFLESYFKLATLQMDGEQWAAAMYNLSRTQMLLGSVSEHKEANMPLYEQVLQYQTECFANLGETKLCRHFGQRTLKLFPHNQYVKQYLDRLPVVVPKPPIPNKAAPAKR